MQLSSFPSLGTCSYILMRAGIATPEENIIPPAVQDRPHVRCAGHAAHAALLHRLAEEFFHK